MEGGAIREWRLLNGLVVPRTLQAYTPVLTGALFMCFTYQRGHWAVASLLTGPQCPRIVHIQAGVL